MAQHVSVQPVESKGLCPKCGEDYYHTLNHIGGSVTYIHSDVPTISVGLDVEYCYVEKLPTSATIDAYASLEIHGGIPQHCTLFFNKKKADADLLQSMEAFTRDHPDWKAGQTRDFYEDLWSTGDFDDEGPIVFVDLSSMTGTADPRGSMGLSVGEIATSARNSLSLHRTRRLATLYRRRSPAWPTA